MTDREKVIKGLEYCINEHKNITDCEHCPYSGIDEGCTSLDDLHSDALALLKAQDNTVCTKERCPLDVSKISDDCNVKTCPWRTEAVKPQLSMSGLWYECPVCGRHMTKNEDNYCARCGKAVKWE